MWNLNQWQLQHFYWFLCCDFAAVGFCHVAGFHCQAAAGHQPLRVPGSPVHHSQSGTSAAHSTPSRAQASHSLAPHHTGHSDILSSRVVWPFYLARQQIVA